MSTPLRSLLSASVGPALAVFTACSAYLNGPLAFATTLGFGLTVVWGIVEIALLSYTPVSSIELEGPSLLEDATHASRRDDAGRIATFPDPNPWRERAA